MRLGWMLCLLGEDLVTNFARTVFLMLPWDIAAFKVGFMYGKEEGHWSRPDCTSIAQLVSFYPSIIFFTRSCKQSCILKNLLSDAVNLCDFHLSPQGNIIE